MFRSFRRYLCGLLVAALVIVQASASPLEEDAAVLFNPLDSWAGRLDVAGRQRMLSQRMTKQMCFALLGVDTATRAKSADTAALEFTAQLENLLGYSRTDGALVTATPEMRAALEQVAQDAGGLTASVRQIAAGDVHSFAMHTILERNDAVLAKMESAMMLLVKHIGTVLGVQTARTLNQTGRQRMLSQKMAKNICLIAAGLDTVKSRVSLKHDYAYFEGVHNALLRRDGATHFDAPPTMEIWRLMYDVDVLWQRLKPQLKAVIDGADPDRKSLVEIAEASDDILRQMDKVMSAWVRALGEDP